MLRAIRKDILPLKKNRVYFFFKKRNNQETRKDYQKFRIKEKTIKQFNKRFWRIKIMKSIRKQNKMVEMENIQENTRAFHNQSGNSISS